METERRTMNVRELRVLDGDGGPRIEGYAALFDAPSEDLGGFVESIKPGAFTRTLQEGDARALWQHDTSYVLGRRKSGTLELAEDEVGLRFRATPPDAQWARDALVSIRRGDVDQMSFGFRVPQDGDRWWNVAGMTHRELLDVELLDVSPVTFPAYPQTTVSVRAKVEEIASGVGTRPRNDRDGTPPGGGDGDAEAASARARLDLLRRRVELAEAEIG
jgi:HK97 family phage prohead protease